ncbi:MAG: hypothetical protein ABSE49_20000 [Polyangiaceae bacterium]
MKDPEVVQAVQAYLAVLKLNEKELPVGLCIPFGGGSDVVEVGVACVTSRTGAGGNRVYDVARIQGAAGSPGGATGFSTVMEIAPP